MPHLTLQEVIDRINIDRVSNNAPSRREPARKEPGGVCAVSQSHHPEFYIPRITRVLAGLLFGAFPSAGRMAGAPKRNQPHSVPS
jgi:hypothetical protein